MIIDSEKFGINKETTIFPFYTARLPLAGEFSVQFDDLP